MRSKQRTESEVERENERERPILLLKIKVNSKTGKRELIWDYLESVDSSYLVGALEMVKQDVLNNWCNKSEEEMGYE